MYQDVLIPTDGSEASESAIEHGIALADRLGATVHALTVREGAGSMKQDHMRTDPDEEVDDALMAVVDAAERSDVPVRTEVLESPDAADAIVTYAEEANVDLIVVGTHDRSGIGEVLQGSIAEGVVETAPVPVVTVRPNASGTIRTDA